MAGCMRLPTDSFGKRIVDKKTHQRLTKIQNCFLEMHPYWQFQYSQVHFSSNLVDSLASPTNGSVQHFHSKGKHKGFSIAIIGSGKV